MRCQLSNYRNRMALLESCCGCSLAISSAVLGVYLLVAYIIAFTIELWWILDPSVTAPVAAYLLCLGYFVLFAFSTVLLHGLSVKRTSFLLLWLFMMGILLGPEAGLVLYMSIHYWRITTINGLIEITCWACRLLVNAAGILCVQSLHSHWREEKSVLLRLEALKMQTPSHKDPNSIDGNRIGKGPRVPPGANSYCNQGFHEEMYLPSGKMTEIKNVDIISRDGGGIGMDEMDGPVVAEEGEVFQNDFGHPNNADLYFASGCNEFNASSFDPATIDSRLPYLTIRQKSKAFANSRRKWDSTDFADGRKIMPKTHSLVDLSVDKLKSVERAKYPRRRLSPPFGIPHYFTDEEEDDVDEDSDSEKRENAAGNSGPKIIKNKNLKILRKFSPFYRRKPNPMVNVYRINPPNGLVKGNGLDVSILDSQLNKVYMNRGMYAFEEKTRKIIFYPPEFFHGLPGRGFRDARHSSGSSLSQSSEDIKQISDVAL